jgi:hypothetical protein
VALRSSALSADELSKARAVRLITSMDCQSRDDVMRTLRQRHAAGFAEGGLNFHDVGSDAVVVAAHPSEIGGQEWPDDTSTVIRFHEGKVVSMQDYRTEAEALAATK